MPKSKRKKAPTRRSLDLNFRLRFQSLPLGMTDWRWHYHEAFTVLSDLLLPPKLYILYINAKFLNIFLDIFSLFLLTNEKMCDIFKLQKEMERRTDDSLT